MCPKCKENTIPINWLLFNKSINANKFSIECSNCHTRIKKDKHFVLAFLTAGALMEGTLVLLLTLLIDKLFQVQDPLYSFISALLFFTIVHFLIEYFSPLKILESKVEK